MPDYRYFQTNVREGSVVGVPGTACHPHWGVVCKIVPAYYVRAGARRPYYYVWRIVDGKPLICPDKRCTTGCCICQYGGWREDLVLYNEREIKLFFEEPQLLDKKWLFRHWSNLKKKDRRKESNAK